MNLLTTTPQGLYCPQGDFYIDPWQGVDKAVITHAHSDHARYGSRNYLSHWQSEPLLRARLGEDISLQTLEYGEELMINGVGVTLFPAGHILGSAQVRVSYKGQVWVASGDYKLEDDGISTPFEAVRCDTFITESTFALPIYKWQDQKIIFENIHQWIQENQSQNRFSVLVAYSLGKSQRLIKMLAERGYEIYCHGAIYNMQKAVDTVLPQPTVHYLQADTPKEMVRQGVIICPGSAVQSGWLRRWQPFVTGVCSGWMRVRGNQRRRNADAGFPLSDHADWPDLLKAIEATGASEVIATHGFSATLARYLAETKGLKTSVLTTKFGTEEDGET